MVVLCPGKCVFGQGKTASNKAATASSRLGSLNSSIKPEKGDTSAKATKSKSERLVVFD